MNAANLSALNRERYQNLPPAGVGINRVRHDKECERIRGSGKFPYLSRFFSTNEQVRGLPETVRFNGGRGGVTLSQAWVNFVIENNSPLAVKYLTRKQSGWVNYGPWPRVEQLCTASPNGTFVVVTRISGNKAYIESYDNAKRPEDYGIDYLQSFGVVYSDDMIGYPPCGLAYTIAIHNPGEQLWIDVRDITFVRAVAP